MIDLRPLNVWCREHKLKMESLKSLAAMGLEPNSLMFSWDLRDGYHSFGIDKDHRKYMTFSLFGSLHQIASVPFGWSSSPYVFAECMAVLVKMLRSPQLPTEAELSSGMRGNNRSLQPRVQRVGGVRQRIFDARKYPP